MKDKTKERQIEEMRKRVWWDDDIFRVRLELAMKERDVNGSMIAKAGACSNGTIPNYGLINRTPTGHTLQKLCTAMQVSADYLLGLSERMDLKK